MSVCNCFNNLDIVAVHTATVAVVSRLNCPNYASIILE